MKNLYKWDSKEVEIYYEKNIKPLVDDGYFPSYKQLFENGYVSFYIALAYWKTSKYPTVNAFCEAYNLKRLTDKKIKWTRESINVFFDENIKPFIKDNKFPITSWFQKKWWEYWWFIWVLNRWKIEWYKNVKDFREQKGLLKWKANTFTKEKIDEFYRTNVIKYVENNRLPLINWFRKQKGELLSWYTALLIGKSWYDSVSDFSKKNGLYIPTSRIWNKITIDLMYEENIKPLINWNKFLPFSKFKELDWKYIEWYNALRNNRVEWYRWIKDFKKIHKLK